MSNETKHEKFVRLRDRRVPAAQQAFKVLRNLTSGNYEYSPNEAHEPHQPLQAERDKIRVAFGGVDTEPAPAAQVGAGAAERPEAAPITKQDELALIKGLDASERRGLAAGSTIFSTAQATMTREVPDANPFRMISKRHLQEVERRRYLTPDEYTRLERALLEEWHRVALEVFVYTGMRHGEVRAFRKDWIKWHNSKYGEIHLPETSTKSAEPRVIPLFPKLRRTLEDWCARAEGEHVFSHWSRDKKAHVPFTSFAGFWRLARTRAGVKDVRIHDLRHTFASWWVQKGGDMGSLKELLGHADMRMVERYAHLNSEAQTRAVEEIDDLM